MAAQILLPISPQSHRPEQTLLIGNYLDVGTVLERYFFGVAAAQVQNVPVKGCSGLRDGSLQQLVPSPFAIFIEPAPSQIILIGFFAPWMVPKFKTGTQNTFGEERRPHPGAKSEDQLHSVPFDDRVALHRTVVRHPCRLAPSLLLGLGQRKPHPSRIQVGYCKGFALLDHPGKSDRHPVKEGNAHLEFVQSSQDGGGGRWFRSGDAQAVADGPTFRAKRLDL